MVRIAQSLRSLVILFAVSLTIVACGGGGGGSTPTPVPDGTPNSFTFTAASDVERSTVITSDEVTISGIDTSTSLAITGGEYSLNGGDFTSAAGSLSNGATLVVRTTSSDQFSDQTTVTLTVGGVEGNFIITTLAQDVEPDAINFAARENAALSTQIASATVEISGINDAAQISITGGEYQIGTGAFTSDAGTIENGESVTVRVMSSDQFSDDTSTTLTIGGVEGVFTVTTLAEDTTPAAFSFTAETGIAINTQVTAQETITVTGINSVADISIVGGEYQIGSNGFTNTAGDVVAGDEVTVRLTSSGQFNTPVNATLTIGGVDGVFTVTTEAQDLEPDAFTFTDQNGVALSTLTTSNAVPINGINDESPVSITGGEYSLDGGTTFTADAGVISEGQEVLVRGTSAPTVSTTVSVTLTVGGVSDIFEIVTFPDTTGPTANIVFPPQVSMTEGATVTVRGTATDDFSSVSNVQVNGVDATDTSGDGSFSTWSVSVSLAEGENDIVVSAADSETNTNISADSVSIRRDSALGDFPDSDNLITSVSALAYDHGRNRLYFGDLSSLSVVDLNTGARSPLSNNSLPDAVNPITSVRRILYVEDSDRLFVAMSSSIIEVSLVDGSREVISENGVPDSSTDFNSPYDLIINPENSDELLLADGSGGVRTVDIVSGVRGVFSDDDDGVDPIPDANNPFQSVRDLAVDNTRTPRVLAADNGLDAVVAIDITTKERTYFSNSSIPNSDAPVFSSLKAVELDSQNDRALVLDTSLISVSLVDGARTTLSNVSVPNGINAPISLQGMAFDDRNGYLFVSDPILDGILAVDVENGERVFVTRGDTPEGG